MGPYHHIYINNETAEPAWDEGGAVAYCPGQGTDTNTAGDTNHRGQRPLPSPRHTHHFPSEAPEILGVAGALYHSPAQGKSVSSVSIKTAGQGQAHALGPLCMQSHFQAAPGET